ncbi:MAG: FtsX-like permease family protein [Pirellulales bacterium]|nr:FtsX-like permease family protein [Pirellulales bacterium]
MTSWRLILREFLHRKANSVLALLSVAVAVACLVASVSALRGYDLETEQVLTRMQKKTEDRVSELKDAYRKIVLKLGFNIFIIPQDVDLHQRHTAGIGGHDMPEEYVTRLANSGIITIDHLLPSLSAAVNWPEQKLQIVLTGVRGEVAIAGKKRKRPLLQPVDKGQIVLGKKVAEVAGLKKGDKTTLLGAEFVVFKTHDARGTQDDNTVWIDLTKAQELLGKEGKITAIQAINCLAPHCHPTAEGIPEVTDEISAVLPDTQVLIDMAKAKTRIDARHRAAEEATAALQQETERRAATRARWDRLAAVVNPLLIIAACAWIGMLAVANVRERRFEIGVLRAIGMTTSRIFVLFLGKAVVIGVLGAVLGIAIGVLCSGGLLASEYFGDVQLRALLSPTMLIATLVFAPIVVIIASWIPALLAAQKDPATILHHD